MIYIAVAQAVVILGLVYVLLRREEHRDNLLTDMMVRVEQERAELLNRIQRPEVTPVVRRAESAAAAHQAEPPRDAVNLARIGTIAPARKEN